MHCEIIKNALDLIKTAQQPSIVISYWNYWVHELHNNMYLKIIKYTFHNTQVYRSKVYKKKNQTRDI